MKIAITAGGPDLSSPVDPRFGRCPYFIIVDPQTAAFEAVENPNLMLGGGAGIQSAQLMAEKEVSVVLTGNCGPNAHSALSAAGIDVIIGCSGVVEDVATAFKTGQLSPADQPNVASHFGMGMGRGGGGGMGMGRGGGGGMGMGRGGGGGMGMGRGGGGGMGMGRGGGGGMGMGQASGMGAGDVPQASSAPQQPTRQQELDLLRQQSEALAGQLDQIQARIRQLQENE